MADRRAWSKFPRASRVASEWVKVTLQQNFIIEKYLQTTGLHPAGLEAIVVEQSFPRVQGDDR